MGGHSSERDKCRQPHALGDGRNVASGAGHLGVFMGPSHRDSVKGNRSPPMLGDSGERILQTKKICHVNLLSFILKGRDCVLLFLQDATVRVHLALPPSFGACIQGFSSLWLQMQVSSDGKKMPLDNCYS